MTQAATGSPGQVLKTGERRTVTREVIGGLPRIVKRFHAPGLLAGARDRYRARREQGALERLHALGLPVPRPHGVRRRDGYWELVMEDLSGMVTLADALEGRAPWPAPALTIASRLGRLLAALVEAGVHHPDLHAGNVLVGKGPAVHLIDLAGVRLGARVAPEDLLSGCAAGLRERDPQGFRSRALASFRQASGLTVDPEALEARARARRRTVVQRRLARYWRESGALRELVYSGARVLLARDVDGAQLPALAGDSPPTGFTIERAGSIGQLTRRWERAARAQMHRLPCEQPVALFAGPTSPRVVLSSPTLSPAQGATPAALGRTLGAIHDRGLRLIGDAADLAVAPDGVVWISGGQLVDHDRLDDILWARQWFDLLGAEPSPPAVAAFLSEARGTALERSRLAAAWRTDG